MTGSSYKAVLFGKLVADKLKIALDSPMMVYSIL